MSVHDEFDDPRDGGIIASLYRALNRREGVAPRGKMRVFLPVAAMLAVFAAVLWYSYPRAEAHRELLTVPVIKADLSPTKTIPADPGGMEIPHRDSTVFQAIREARRDRDTSGRIENLLPEAEQPLPREQLFAGLKTELQDADPLDDGVPEAPVIADESADEGQETVAVQDMADQEKAVREQADREKFAAKKAVQERAAQEKAIQDKAVQDKAIQDQAAQEKAAREKVAADKMAAEKKAAEKEAADRAAADKIATDKAAAQQAAVRKAAAEKAAAEKIAAERALAATAPAAGVAGDYYVQLVSLRTPDEAQMAWKSFQKDFPAQLGALDMRVQKAELGDRGTYYRVQGGPVAEARARDICEAISRQKPGSCLVVRR